MYGNAQHSTMMLLRVRPIPLDSSNSEDQAASDMLLQGRRLQTKPSQLVTIVLHVDSPPQVLTCLLRTTLEGHHRHKHGRRALLLFLKDWGKADMVILSLIAHDILSLLVWCCHLKGSSVGNGRLASVGFTLELKGRLLPCWWGCLTLAGLLAQLLLLRGLSGPAPGTLSRALLGTDLGYIAAAAAAWVLLLVAASQDSQQEQIHQAWQKGLGWAVPFGGICEGDQEGWRGQTPVEQAWQRDPGPSLHDSAPELKTIQRFKLGGFYSS
ncbi:MAG: hypothetical protein FRX49_07679 [Trebouxia sp. A1-2]|nr:MAG: hypothetical protein FRX49_07679 [Trebouxia sp. A1-2]